MKRQFTLPVVIPLMILGVMVWVLGQEASREMGRTVEIQGGERVVTEYEDGSESISLRGMFPCTAVARIGGDGEIEVKCVGSEEAVADFLSGGGKWSEGGEAAK